MSCAAAGFELSVNTLGVIGTGRVGPRVVQIAHGFGLRVIASDRRPDEAAAQRLGFRQASIDETLAAADTTPHPTSDGAGCNAAPDAASP